jgi:hemoglobin/transferrin/lactoferrin receptor protein
MKLHVLWMMLLLASVATGQTLTVVDAKTNEPLEMVQIGCKGYTKQLFTNAEGKAEIAPFKGLNDIIVKLFGYGTLEFNYEQLKENEFIVALNPTVFTLNEVVISANKWSQLSSDVPLKVTSLSPKEIAFRNPQTAADLLGSSGDVFIQKSQQGGGSPMIRGFATNRLLYTVDGIRMNTAIFRGGNIQNVISLDPFAMESVEVLFGPNSTVYGSDAIGGVMGFQTLSPKLSTTDDPYVTGKASMRYSSANNENTGHFDINVGWKKWAVLTSVSVNKFDHLRQGSNGPDDYVKPYYVDRIDSMDVVIEQDDPLLQIPSGYEQMNLMQKVRFSPNEHWDFEYAFHYSETSSYGRYDRHNRVKNGAPRYGEWNYGPQKWMMNLFSVSHLKKTLFYDQMSIRLAQQSFEESRISRDFNSAMREIREEGVIAYSANVDFSKALGSRNNLFYGAEYVINDVNSNGLNQNINTNTMSPGPARYPQAAWQTFGVYVNDEHKITEDITLQAGVRYTHYLLDATFDTSFYPFPFTEAKTNDGALTGGLGLVYKLNDKTVFRMNASTAFRSPNVDDIGKVFDSEPGTVVIPNPGLSAEYAYNGDIGVTKIFGDVLKLDLTGYYTILQNAMVRRDFTLNGMDSINYDGQLSQVQALQNAAAANVYGIQVGLEVNFTKGFLLTSRFNYQQGEEEMNDGSVSPSRHAAPWFGITRLSYTHKGLRLELYTQYQGERTHENLSVSERDKNEIYALDENGNAYSPSWYTLNFKMRYQFTDHLSVGGGVENITDQRYRPYSSGLSGAGRNFILSVTANF